MIVVQWGMAEFIRNQNVSNLIGDDQKLIAEYKKALSSEQKTAFWKRLVETKLQGPELAQNMELVVRFQRLNDRRDHIVHRLWGGGMEPGTLGAPADASTTDAVLHRMRDEKKKTKSKDARANISWNITFTELRKIANEIAQLNQDILVSWLPVGTPPGTHHIWAFLDSEGRLQVGIASGAESDPDRDA
ncbi:hypothetical protein [Bradyrhizobium japonicum]|uniref:hypothetical protein n=1 Tax=Bradyrhizobium japonicum TaxID=375 RepID=UPI0004891930|nr:hypothetical protein [Bradyrhizobium japonicum]MCP1738203.1 hypothetical protein [Bradyrhizobium japonicum]MCP1855987.1 hypothetical protein [Bradyrhizobium japonicum]MCP1897198.1 hypothetical protein [Bradyrhizobium japonicum]MCW2330754.1 hypothetical protein [Bradyrhizobium japonicum]WLB96029.1 hypothetical protein QIH92_41385 [Bradyrhizobium japonicum USDA 123]